MIRKNFCLIQSKDNQKLKLARAVRDGRENGRIFVEGVRLCEEILQTGLKIQSVFFTPDFAETERGKTLLNKLQNGYVDLNAVDEKLFSSVSDTKTSQGIIIIAEKPITGQARITAELTQFPLLLLLHKINNPSNLGAILRTAEAVGVNGVIATKGTADIFSPKSLRGAMGAAFRLPLWTNADFFEVLEWAGETEIKTVCADVKSETNYTAIKWQESKMLIFGSEGHGLTDAELSSTDETLVIPMANSVESLNVAVACGVILFEAKRQRDQS